MGNCGEACQECHYTGLRGIILDRVPPENILDQLNADGIYDVVKFCYPDMVSGVAAAFWGIDENLSYARIYDLDGRREKSPSFDTDDLGKIIFPFETPCGNKMDISEIDPEVLPLFESSEGMRQILQQSRDYKGLENIHERLERYYMITAGDIAGCCDYGGGEKIITLNTFEQLVTGQYPSESKRSFGKRKVKTSLVESVLNFLRRVKGQ